MKTNLNDQLLADAESLAAQQRTSLTRVIEEGLQLRLRGEQPMYPRPVRWLATALESLCRHQHLMLRDADVVRETLSHFRATPALGFAACLVPVIAGKADLSPLGTFDKNFARSESARRLQRTRHSDRTGLSFGCFWPTVRTRHDARMRAYVSNSGAAEGPLGLRFRGYLQRVVDVDSEMPNRGFGLRVTERVSSYKRASHAFNI